MNLRDKVTTAYITHSLDGNLYYIAWGNHPSRHWVGVDAHPGPVPEEKKHGQFDGYIQINKDDGTVYHRLTMPFAFWSVKSAHDSIRIDKDDDLFKDYAAFEQWL